MSCCNFVCQHFGASYPDAVCIDGYLWDADSGESDGGDGWLYSSGGDDPCPSCNSGEAASRLMERFEDQRPTWAESPWLGWSFNAIAYVRAWRQVRRFVASQNERWDANRHWVPVAKEPR